MIKNVELCDNRTRLTKELEISSAEIEKQIQSYPYSGENKERDEFVENKLRMPPMIYAFYGFIFFSGKVPSEDEFTEEYLQNPFFSKVGNNNYEVSLNEEKHLVSKSALKARILRTYPSLIRDFHFYCLVRESNYFEHVFYSCNDDYYDKVDMKVIYKGKWFSLGMLLDSSRSEEFRQKKQFRHKNDEDVIYIKLSKDKCRKCGKFWLYTEEHVDLVLAEIQKKAQQT